MMDLHGDLTLPVYTLEESFQDALALTVGKEMLLSPYSPSYSLCTFTPKEDGYYLFSYDQEGVTTYLYDAKDDRYYNGEGFGEPFVFFTLQGGRTYYLVISQSQAEAPLLRIEHTNDAALTATPKEGTCLVYGRPTGGYWEGENYFFLRSSILDALNISLSFGNGSSLSLDDSSSGLTLETEVGITPLLPGKREIPLRYLTFTCTVEIEILDYKSLAKQNAPLTLDMPLEALTGEQYFTFTPLESKTYWFVLTASEWIDASLFSEEEGLLAEASSYASPWGSFDILLSADLTAGQTYYLGAHAEGAYSLLVTEEDPQKEAEIDEEKLEGKKLTLFLLLDDSSFTRYLLQEKPAWLSSLTDSLSSSHVDWRLAVLSARDIGGYGPSITSWQKEDQSPWFTAEDTLSLQEAWQREIATDSTFLLWDGLLTITQSEDFSFSSLEEADVLCITTCWGSDSNQMELFGEEDMLEKLRKRGLSYSAMTDTGIAPQHTNLVSATGGILLNIQSDPELAMKTYASHLLKRLAQQKEKPQVTLGVSSRPAAKNKAKGIALSWKAVPEGVLYQIYRRKEGGKYKLLAETKDLTYLDTQVKSLATYSYKVRALGYETAEVLYKTGKKSKAKALTYLPACQKIKVSKKGVVTWKSIKNVTGYQVLVSTQKAMKNPITLTIKGYKKTKATLKKLDPATYYVTVRAYVEKDGRTSGPLGRAKKYVVKKK